MQNILGLSLNEDNDKEENIYSPMMVFGTYLPTAFEIWSVLTIKACIIGQNNFSIL